MNPLDYVFSTDVALAYAALLIGVVAEPLLEYRLTRVEAGGAVLEFAWTHVFGPLFRAALIAMFVFIAYPAVIGVRSAPPLSRLVADTGFGMTALMNVLFVLSIVAPLVVRPLRRPGLVVPLQGFVATAVVFSWFTAYLGATSAGWWPGTLAAIAMLVMTVIAHRLAAETGLVLGQAMDRRFHTDGFERIVPHVTEILSQTPVILYYGLTLGRQIAV